MYARKRGLVIGIAITALVGAALGAVVPAGATGRWQTLDDASASFRYAGDWKAAPGAGKLQGSDHYSFTTGDAYEVSFTGVRARLLGTVDAHHGIAAVSIDGRPAVAVDFFSATREYQQRLYRTPVLRKGHHVLRVEVTGRKSSASTGTVVVADRVDVDPGTAVTTTAVPAPQSSHASTTVAPITTVLRPTTTVAAGSRHQVALPSSARTFYVSTTGSDANSGTRQDEPWRSLDKVASAALAPGDRVLLRSGDSWSGGLRLTRDGAAGKEIVIGSYGSGAQPRITGASECVRIEADHVIVQGLMLTGCSWAGAEIRGKYDVMQGSTLTNNVAGVATTGGSAHNKVLDNIIKDNDKMSVNTRGGDDDSGAFGVLLNGDTAEIAYNTISGSDAPSYDYGRDGAAVEIFGGIGNDIHHNVTYDNETFSELGNPRTANTRFAYNVVTSVRHGAFLVVRGAQDGLGPNKGTVVVNNSVYLPQGEGVICYAGCDSSILTLQRNIIVIGSGKVADVDGNAVVSDNVYSGPSINLRRGNGDLVADPKFVDPAKRDLHLKPGSPAAGRGAYA